MSLVLGLFIQSSNKSLTVLVKLETTEPEMNHSGYIILLCNSSLTNFTNKSLKDVKMKMVKFIFSLVIKSRKKLSITDSHREDKFP